MPTDSDRLAADGIPIDLADGTHYLRYTMRGLKVLEDRFDGMDGVTEFLTGRSKKRFAPLADMLAAGLAHEGVDPAVLDDLIEPARYGVYFDAAVAALNIAFPSATSDAPPKETAQAGSTGEPFTTSPPSGSGAPTPSSGP